MVSGLKKFANEMKLVARKNIETLAILQLFHTFTIRKSLLIFNIRKIINIVLRILFYF